MKTDLNGTRSLAKAMDLIDAVAAAPHGLSHSELSQRVGLPRATMFRVAKALIDRGLLRRDTARKRYLLGALWSDYARRAINMPDLVAAASLELRALRDVTGETTYLGMRDGLEVLSLDRVDGAHSQRSSSALGLRKPLYCTSQGKAILSAMPRSEIETLLRDLPLKALTSRTITDRRRLLAEIELTSNRGFSVDDEEIVDGVRCVGAPILDNDGQIRGVISVAGPAFRLTLARLEMLGPEVAQTARRIGAHLGKTRSTLGSGALSVIEGGWAFNGAFPAWSEARQCLCWADTLAPAVHVATRSQDQLTASLEAPIDALLQCETMNVAASSGHWWVVDGTGPASLLGPCPQSLLAVATDPLGAVWASVWRDGRSEIGRLSLQGELEVKWKLAEPVQALAWDPLLGRMYATGPESGSLYVLTPDRADVRRLTTLPKASGRLGGLAVDTEGGLWCALVDGWCVMRFTPDGHVDLVTPLPVQKPTALAFGDADLRSLYITSARHGLSIDALDHAPLSGMLFRIETDFIGTPVLPARLC